MSWQLIATLVGIVTSPVLAFLTGRRTSSGRIATTEAAQLWQLLSDDNARLRLELAAAHEREHAP